MKTNDQIYLRIIPRLKFEYIYPHSAAQMRTLSRRWRYFCLREVKDYGIPKVIVMSVVLSNLLPEEQWPVYPKDRR